jgi:hypothetical protein
MVPVHLHVLAAAVVEEVLPRLDQVDAPGALNALEQDGDEARRRAIREDDGAARPAGADLRGKGQRAAGGEHGDPQRERHDPDRRDAPASLRPTRNDPPRPRIRRLPGAADRSPAATA